MNSPPNCGVLSRTGRSFHDRSRTTSSSGGGASGTPSLPRPISPQQLSRRSWLLSRRSMQSHIAISATRSPATSAMPARSCSSHSSHKPRQSRFSHRKGQRFESLAALEDAAAIGRELQFEPDRFESLRDAAIACMAHA